MDDQNLTVVILAGGKGTRMSKNQNKHSSLARFRGQNKVTYEVAGKPIIIRILDKLKAAKLEDIVVVVGHAKNSVLELLPQNIKTAVQTRRLGTGHATKSAINKIPSSTENVLVLYGDDAFWYNPQNFEDLIKLHKVSNADVTFCTTNVENPTGLGRILRNQDNRVIGIVEEKNATENQKKIKEVNLGGFVFKKEFLKQNISKLPKNEITGEYYLTDMVDAAVKEGKKIETLNLKDFTWRGINTPDELKAAEQLLA